MFIHLVFDLLALASAGLISLWFWGKYRLERPAGIIQPAQYHYYQVALLLGLAVGSVGFGTLNLYLAGHGGVAKSMLGGICGAVVAAEIFKYFSGIRQSTGLYFVPGLLVLMAVGRVGCFLAGLPDFTYGVVTDLPWGVDFGDGLARHPVQLYESATLLLFLGVLLRSFSLQPAFWQRRGFYLFILGYAGQRFGWEFLKPYPPVLAGLNLFHGLSLLLIIYALFMLTRNHAHDP